MSRKVYRKALDRLLDGAMQPIEVVNGELSSKPAFVWMRYGAPVEIVEEQRGLSETGCNLFFNNDLACCNTRSNFPVGGWEAGEDPEGFYAVMMACIQWVVEPRAAMAIFLNKEDEKVQAPKDDKVQAPEDDKEPKEGLAQGGGGAIPKPKWTSTVFPPGFFNPEDIE